MLAIARALIGLPDLLLLDEPSMGLAPIITEQIFDVIRDINRKGVTVILVEQNAGLALKMARTSYCSRIWGNCSEIQMPLNY